MTEFTIDAITYPSRLAYFLEIEPMKNINPIIRECVTNVYLNTYNSLKNLLWILCIENIIQMKNIHIIIIWKKISISTITTCLLMHKYMKRCRL